MVVDVEDHGAAEPLAQGENFGGGEDFVVVFKHEPPGETGGQAGEPRREALLGGALFAVAAADVEDERREWPEAHGFEDAGVVVEVPEGGGEDIFVGAVEEGEVVGVGADPHAAGGDVGADFPPQGLPVGDVVPAGGDGVGGEGDGFGGEAVEDYFVGGVVFEDAQGGFEVGKHEAAETAEAGRGIGDFFDGFDADGFVGRAFGDAQSDGDVAETDLHGHDSFVFLALICPRRQTISRQEHNAGAARCAGKNAAARGKTSGLIRKSFAAVYFTWGMLSP